MLQQGIVQPCSIPWAAAVAMVKKKDGTRRFCVNYCHLNDITIKDAHSLPQIDNTLELLHEAKLFLTLDIKAGYWQIPIWKEDKKKMAFMTSFGKLQEYEMMPFSLCNAPSNFSRLIDLILSGMAWEICLAYLDNVIVFTKECEEHLKQL